MSSLKIILATLLWFILYGILNDQITIRICAEYFTIFHPRIVDSDDITVIALAWGVRSMWWIGLGASLIVAFILRFLSANKIEGGALSILFGHAFLLTCLAFCIALIAGIIGYGLAALHIIPVGDWFQGIPQAAEARFLLVLFWNGALVVCAFLASLFMGSVIWQMSNKGRRWL